MELTPGLKLRSAASTAQVIVIRAPAGDCVLTCAGGAMGTGDPGAPDEAAGGPDLLVGKRYADPEGRVELLCTVPGAGPLALDGAELSEQAAKSLPSSD